ncbi:MAG: hypothetical protein CL799_09625 [Chromatiales bacterium]|nr:hypothetical protein [Chromatiales bacterium]
MYQYLEDDFVVGLILGRQTTLEVPGQRDALVAHVDCTPFDHELPLRVLLVGAIEARDITEPHVLQVLEYLRRAFERVTNSRANKTR